MLVRGSFLLNQSAFDNGTGLMGNPPPLYKELKSLDKHINVTFECHRRLMLQHVMEFLIEVVEAGRPSDPHVNVMRGPPVTATPFQIGGNSDTYYVVKSGSSSDGVHDDEYIPETPSDGTQYILPASHRIPNFAKSFINSI
ncbi:hypothetical protein PIB30_005481 [Stylosanthes scabra]|uniref:Uncharacterized protein n=1 Tax=Stylosanthes scabra TaxID=79078 RepID=A0ABU6Z1V3_9FABA|nr:hypothetical protein [Stylosanthes scabra]